jgi:hypothetical protein
MIVLLRTLQPVAMLPGNSHGISNATRGLALNAAESERYDVIGSSRQSSIAVAGGLVKLAGAFPFPSSLFRCSQLEARRVRSVGKLRWIQPRDEIGKRRFERTHAFRVRQLPLVEAHQNLLRSRRYSFKLCSKYLRIWVLRIVREQRYTFSAM